MMQISIIIFNALTIFFRSSVAENLSSDRQIADPQDDTYMEPTFRSGIEANSTLDGVLATFFYLTQHPKLPSGQECIKCFYEIYQRKDNKPNPCSCLPCWIPHTKKQDIKNYVIDIFKNHPCSKIKTRHGIKQRRKLWRMEPKNNAKEIKSLEDDRSVSADWEDWNEDLFRKIQPWAMKMFDSDRSSSESTKRSGEDSETFKLNTESQEFLREEVRRVFNGFLSKIARANIHKEEEKKAENSEATPTKSERTNNQRSAQELDRGPVKLFENQYTKPSYIITSRSQQVNLNRHNDNNDRSEKEVKVKDSSPTERMDSDAKSSQPKGRKSIVVRNKDDSKKKEVREKIPEEVRMGSLFFRRPSTMRSEDESDDDDEGDDKLLSSAKEATFRSNEKSDQESKLHNKAVSAEDDLGQNNNVRESRNLPAAGNTPSSSARSSDEKTQNENKASRSMEVSDCELRMGGDKIELKLDTNSAAEERISKVTNEENQSAPASSDKSESQGENTRRLDDGKGVKETEANQPVKTRIEEKVSTEEKKATSEESKAGINSKSLNGIQRSAMSTENEEPTAEKSSSWEEAPAERLAFLTSAESIPESSEKQETTSKVGRKFERSTYLQMQRAQPPLRDNVAEEDLDRSASEDPSNFPDTKYRASLVLSTDKLFKKGNTKSNTYNEDASTEERNAGFVIEVESDSQERAAFDSAEDPVFKVRMHLLPDSDPANVYNFLSKFIRRSQDPESFSEERAIKRTIK